MTTSMPFSPADLHIVGAMRINRCVEAAWVIAGSSEREESPSTIGQDAS